MSYQKVVKDYLKALQQIYKDSLADRQHTAELSFRTPLDRLFNGLAVELNGSSDIVVVQEPRNQGGVGRPDWRIHDRNTLGVYGYIEAKGLTPTAFDITPYLGQFDRYSSLGHKLVVTDGIDFVYTFDGGTPRVVSLIDKACMDRPDWSRLPLDPQFELMMREFFAKPSPQMCSEGELVEQVALRAKNLSEEIQHYLAIPLKQAKPGTEEPDAVALLGGLRALVYNHNDPSMRTDKVFADFSAQVIMFTLLYAHRVECDENDSPADKERKIEDYLARDLVDGQALRPFLTIIHHITEHSDDDGFILAATNECIRFLSFVSMAKEQYQRPDYHKLFELFLSKFDPQSRFDYGAYYTPSELADCVVRLVDVIARESFDGASVFDDDNTLIDPCCGTGSFLERIRRDDTRHGAYTLCGIEILPAPYMLANYRMAIMDEEAGTSRSRDVLLLANTLSDCVFGKEPADTDTVEGFELDKAREVSSHRITLVIGNPPSSDSSTTNVGPDFSTIQTLMEDFRPPVADRHGRQNTQKQVNNPYLQFLRWGCEMLEKSNGNSVLAYIVPATFLEAESYKYARKYIAEHFSAAWVVAVDADARAGIRSDSMFNTQQGRAILIATRRYGDQAPMSEYGFVDISDKSKAEKQKWLARDARELMKLLTRYPLDSSNDALRPSLPFNQELYDSYWPVSGEKDDPNVLFKHHCSGVKLAPSSLFTHVKGSMLKRRSNDILRGDAQAVEEWFGSQDKPPREVEIRAFADALHGLGGDEKVDSILDQNIVDYAFRPFLPVKAFLWEELLQKFSHVGGGGTRRRPELAAAFSNEKTVGFALSHSPKDQNDILKPFASFCWHIPDNDMCRRGNAYIYVNQYPGPKKSPALGANINDGLSERLTALLGMDGLDLATEVVFYTYAVLCSQVYLDEFEGALFTVNRPNMRPRVPIVDSSDVFRGLADCGRRIAEVESRDHKPPNLAGFDYDACMGQVPKGFKLSWSRAMQPFDEQKETVTLTDGRTGITVPCPLGVQRLTIGGYEVVKNVWMKFNSYDYTNCPFTAEDMSGFLDLVNKLLEYVDLVGEVDDVMRCVIRGDFPLITPNGEERPSCNDD